MHGALVAHRSRTRFPIIASEGVPREPGLASYEPRMPPKSATGKQLGNDHAHTCPHTETDDYAVRE